MYSYITKNATTIINPHWMAHVMPKKIPKTERKKKKKRQMPLMQLARTQRSTCPCWGDDVKRRPSFTCKT